MNRWLKRTLLLAGGGAAGFAYYYIIGCASGSCPITSNPFISTAYGAVVGIVLGFGDSRKRT